MQLTEILLFIFPHVGDPQRNRFQDAPKRHRHWHPKCCLLFLHHCVPSMSKEFQGTELTLIAEVPQSVWCVFPLAVRDAHHDVMLPRVVGSSALWKDLQHVIFLCVIKPVLRLLPLIVLTSGLLAYMCLVDDIASYFQKL